MRRSARISTISTTRFRHARASRPDLPLLDPTQARAYAAGVRDHAFEVLESSPLSGERLVDRGFAFAMIAQHEQQHDETMLATHQLRSGPTALRAPDAPRVSATPVVDEVVVPAGDFVMGTDLDPWALDNERPAHRVSLPAFAIERFPVTNDRWLRVHRRRRVRASRALERAGVGAPGRGRPDRAAVLGA